MSNLVHGFFPNALNHISLPGETRRKVCIVMRTRSRPILLVRALASVLAQRHRDWHLYLVNDGGDRREVDALVSEYLPAFGSRLSVTHNQTSLGMEGASNVAVRKMEGDFLAVHDDDDAWHPDFLHETVAFLSERENSGFAAVVTQAETVWERIAEDRVIEMSRAPFPSCQGEVDMLHLLNRNCFPPITLLLRMEAAREVGYFNESLPVLGDWDYHWRILLVGDIGTLNKSLAYYHHRQATQSSSAYSNTVVSAQDKHARYDIAYRNAAVRRFLKENPASFGLLHTLLRRMDNDQILHRQQFGWAHDRHVDLQGRMAVVQAETHALRSALSQQQALIVQLNATLESAVRIPRALWRRLLPLRVWVAWLRGRRPSTV